MLKKIVAAAIIASSVTTHAWAAEVKVGFVNVVGLLSVAPQAEASRKTLETEFANRDKTMVDLQKKIEAAEKKYSVDAAVLGEAERTKREREILVLKRDFKRLQSEFNEDLSLRKNEELRSLQKTVAEAIDTVAKEEGYDLIVNEGVVFASKNIDISKKILAVLKTQHEAASKKKGAAKKK